MSNDTAFREALQDAERRAAAVTDDPDLQRRLVAGVLEARRRRGVAKLRGRHRAIEAVGRLGRPEPIEAWELAYLATPEEPPVIEEAAAADPLQFVLDLRDVVPDLNPDVLRVGARRDDPRQLWRPTGEAMHRWPWVDMDTPTSANVIALEVRDGERAAAAVDAGDIPPPRWRIDLAWGAAALAWTLARPVHLRPGCRTRPVWAWWVVADYLAEVTGGDPGWGSGRPRNPLVRNPLHAVRKGRGVTWSAEGCISLGDVRRQYLPRGRVPTGERRGLLPRRRALVVVPDAWPTWRQAQRRGGRRRASMDSFEDARKAGLKASIATRVAQGKTRRAMIASAVLDGFTDAEIARALRCSPKTVQRHRLAAGLTRPRGGARR